MLSGKKTGGEEAKRTASDMAVVVNSKPPIYTQDDREAQARRLAECICERKKTTIRCKRCGALYFNRVARTCPTHPNIYFLCDLRGCFSDRCQGQLGQWEELPIDHPTYLKLVRVSQDQKS